MRNLNKLRNQKNKLKKNSVGAKEYLSCKISEFENIYDDKLNIQSESEINIKTQPPKRSKTSVQFYRRHKRSQNFTKPQSALNKSLTNHRSLRNTRVVLSKSSSAHNWQNQNVNYALKNQKTVPKVRKPRALTSVGTKRLKLKTETKTEKHDITNKIEKTYGNVTIGTIDQNDETEGMANTNYCTHASFAPTRFHRQPQFKML